VEFALIAPLFILVIIGLVEFSRLFSAYLAMSDGARAGTRVAALDASNVVNITKTRQAVKDVAARSALTITDAQISITYLDGTNPVLSQPPPLMINGSDARLIIGCWPSSSSSYVPAASDGTCGVTTCPSQRGNCAQAYPGDIIEVTVQIPWLTQTLIIQRLLPGGSGFIMTTSSSSTIEQ
jgi:Flp pilus assembly protein TadG